MQYRSFAISESIIFIKHEIMMSLMVIVALLIQIISIGLLFFRFGRTTLYRPGVLLIIGAFFYHGVPEILNHLFPEQNQYYLFLGITNYNNIEEVLLLISIGMLFYVLTYINSCKLPRQPYLFNNVQLEKLFNYIKTNYIIILSIWIIVYIVGGVFAFYASHQLNEVSSGSLMYYFGGISTMGFMLMMLIFPLLWILLPLPKLLKSPIIIVILACLLSCVIPMRRAVIFSFIGVLLILGHMDYTITKRQFIIILLCCLVVIPLISTTRMHAGREYMIKSTVSERIELYISGIKTLPSDITIILSDTIYRLDGNVFASYGYSEMKNGKMPAMLAPMVILNMLIPSVLLPSKFNEYANVKLYEADYFNMPSGTDYLPTYMTTILHTFGLFMFLPILLILGYFMAKIDYWLIYSPGLLSVFVYIWLIASFIDYEHEISGLMLTARTLLIIFFPVYLLSKVKFRRNKIENIC